MSNGRTGQPAQRATLGQLVVRYLPSEIAGTAAALLASWWAAPAGTAAVVVAAVVAECIGFYGVIGVKVAREQWPHTAGRPHRRLRTARRTLALLVAEFGPSEALDTVLIRPALLLVSLQLIDNVLLATLIGKIAADLVFYAVAAVAFHLTVRSGVRAPRADTADRPTAQPEHHRAAHRILQLPAVQHVLRTTGTPLLVLEPEVVADRYRHLCRALPSVRFHFAVKALAHEAAVRAVADEGGWFDVASTGELNLVRRCGIGGDRIIHTHPVKSRRTIDEARAAGVRTFVVDTPGEVAKFRPSDGVSLLVRLSFPNAAAVSDLSTKFGVEPDKAADLVQLGVAAGLDIAGFSFHVGSQLDDVRPWERAARSTLALIDRLAGQGIVLRVLDIGGGLPAPYDGSVIGAIDLARVLDPLLAGRRLQVLAEPGRAVVAEAMTLIAGVVGVDERGGVRWCHLDDGVYGSWSNVVFEHLTPPLVPVPRRAGPVVRTTLAGPTCDSVDVVLRDRMMPTMEVGDLVISPLMGAYTSVSATTFNGLAPTPILVLPVEVTSVPAQRARSAAPVTPSQPVRIPDLTPTITVGRQWRGHSRSGDPGGRPTTTPSVPASGTVRPSAVPAIGQSGI